MPDVKGLRSPPAAKRRHRRVPLIMACLSAPLAVAGCVSLPSRTGLAAPGPAFDPQRFFVGQTTGEGELRVILSPPHAVHVVGDGRLATDGTLLLTQRIEAAGRPARSRTWQLRATGAGQYAGTLSDATGPVLADSVGNRLHLRFHAKGGLGIEQWLFLQPGGTVALNRMVVRKFGLPVATLSETIRRVP